MIPNNWFQYFTSTTTHTLPLHPIHATKHFGAFWKIGDQNLGFGIMCLLDLVSVLCIYGLSEHASLVFLVYTVPIFETFSLPAWSFVGTVVGGFLFKT
jgi:hypothetical protein